VKINTVTVTGADDTFLHAEMEQISNYFPHVEFAILMSRKYLPEGTSRFPSANWLKKLQDLSPDVNLAIHICGQWVTEIYEGKWPVEELAAVLGSDFFKRIDRWQLNTHGRKFKCTDAFLDSLSNGPKSVIFQNDGKNNVTINAAIARGCKNVGALFDLSHGTGVLPTAWEAPLEGIYCGYAGGLSPENVAAQCDKLSEFVRVPIWIDAETHLRSTAHESSYDYFDLKRVYKFLAEAERFTK
jgi:hypothetical protein